MERLGNNPEEHKPRRLSEIGRKILEAAGQAYKYGGPYAMAHGVPPYVAPETLYQDEERLYDPQLDGPVEGEQDNE